MNNGIQFTILRILIASPEYISAQKIADSLKVSRRTIFNNMSEVRQICENHGAKLISSKSKGYKIEEYNNIFKFVEEQNYDFQKLTNYECKLYIIYLLLIEDSPIRISELEEIVYLSRPTIYKLVEEMKEWFKQFDMNLKVTRSGISINGGERRYRDCLKNWILEVKSHFHEKNEQDQDYFKLKKSCDTFFVKDYPLVYTATEKICEEFKVHCSNFELSKMAVLLEIIMYRNQNNHYTTLSKRFYELITSIYTLDKIEKIQNLMNDQLAFSFNLEEVIYFIASLITGGDLSNRDLLTNQMDDIKINPDLLQDIRNYLLTQFKFNETIINELMDEILYIIKREILFQIKGCVGVSAKHYGSLLNNYKITVSIANDIYQIICNYYYLQYHEKTICNLVFSMLGIIQKHKRNLKTILYHDCDIFEYQYVLLNFQKLPYISLVFVTDSEDSMNEFLENNQVDLIFSTHEYQHASIETVFISKMFENEEISETVKKLNKMYEVTNYLDIIQE